MSAPHLAKSIMSQSGNFVPTLSFCRRQVSFMPLDPRPPWHDQQWLAEKLLCACIPSKSPLACQEAKVYVASKVKGREEPGLGLVWGQMNLLQTKPSSKKARWDITMDSITHSGAKLIFPFYVFSADRQRQS